MPASIYKPLDRDGREIRLLYLDWNGSEDEVISCRMIMTSLENCPRYAALSYVWGDQPPDVETIVNGTRVLITKNLVIALRHMRRWRLFRGTVSLPLWADAICINQEDISERGHQVELMGLVFSSAVYVISWLGEPTGGRDDIGFGAIRRFAPFGENIKMNRAADKAAKKPLTFEQIIREPSPCMGHYSHIEEYIGAINLAESSYWTRTWIVQEMVLASNPERHLFCYGNEYVNYRELESYNEFVDELRLKFAPTIPLIPLIKYLKESGRDVPAYVVAGISNRCSSTSPHDAIYGLLGIIEMDIEPDYKKPLVDLYREWFAKVLAQGDYRDMLTWAGIGHYGASDGDGLPSWMPNLGSKAKRLGYWWENPLGTPWKVPWELDASKDVPLAAFHLESPTIKSGDILSIRGVFVDTISEIEIYHEKLWESFSNDKLKDSGIVGLPTTKSERCARATSFRTKGEKEGFGPSKLLPGDAVCFLDGLSWTAALRRLDESTWAYVGTCHIDYLELDKFLEMIREGVLRIEEFSLR
ncbi:hypothetical protein AAE478_005093 [Parahypoxylon ruwenzoriense]